MPHLDRNPSECDVHDVGRNQQGYRVCKHCGISLQSIVASRPRAVCKGDFRVVCEGPKDSDASCSIGPSDPNPQIVMAKAAIDDHQTRAREIDGTTHQAKIIQI